jgi:outer membrane protein
MKRIFLVLLLATVTSVFSQTKVGTINTEFVISQMPELKDVQAEMETYNKDLGQKIQKKYAEYQELVAKFEKEKDSLNEVVRKIRENEIFDMEESINKLQKNAQQLARVKRDELMRPLYEQIGQAIEKIVEEQGYTQIFNENNGLVYGSPEHDLTEEVLNEMGIEIEKPQEGEPGEVQTAPQD